MGKSSIFIKNIRYLVTVDGTRRIIEDGAVAIEDSKIVAVGKSDQLKKDYGSTDIVIDGSNKVATPGLINCHVHTPYYVVRGLADNLTLPTWLSEIVIPAQNSLSDGEAYVSSLATLIESLKYGVTTVVDTGEGKIERVPDAAENVGIRIVVGKSVHDVPTVRHLKDTVELHAKTEQCAKAAENFYRKHHGRANGRVNIWFCPSHERAVSDELLRECKERADKHGVGLESHVSASITSVLRHNELFGLPAIKRFKKAGALGPNLLIVHSNWLSDDEIELIRSHDVKVCHCPSSATAGGFGTFSKGKFVEMMEQGVTVALGSDNCAHSNFLDMLRVAYLAGAHRDVRADPSLLPPEELLEMLTLNGAKATLMADKIGSIEKGKKADIVLFDVNRFDWRPLHSPVSNLIFSTTGHSVDTVIVDGNIVVEKGRATTVDEEEILSKVEEVAEDLPARIGLKRSSIGKWPIE
ncbi:MAG: amidohydrolase [Thaumarchaeota archaeon]|nr:amidohydrolase [Nitrososphaerota archaeon]